MATGRNAPCPCGSGKKYKKCCLMVEFRKEQEERSAAKKRLEDALVRASEVKADPSLLTPEERMKRLTVLSVMAMMSGGMVR